jgi:hypothetical protein
MESVSQSVSGVQNQAYGKYGKSSLSVRPANESSRLPNKKKKAGLYLDNKTELSEVTGYWMGRPGLDSLRHVARSDSRGSHTPSHTTGVPEDLFEGIKVRSVNMHSSPSSADV